jgi:hypothetical protein
MPELSNIRSFLGWIIGKRVIDVTAGDPPDIPDADKEDEHYIVLHFDNGGTLDVPIGEHGFSYFNPDDEDEDDNKKSTEEDDSNQLEQQKHLRVLPMPVKTEQQPFTGPIDCITQFAEQAKDGTITPTQALILWFSKDPNTGIITPHRWYANMSTVDVIAMCELTKHMEIEDWKAP